jgi:RNA methyltransferase, TrmH family
MSSHLKRYQKSYDYSYVPGVYSIIEMLDARPEHVQRVLVSTKSDRNEGVAKIQERCAQRGIPVQTDDKAIERLFTKESHLAVGVYRKYACPLAADRNHVVLVGPRDMGNVGTIARTMLGFGVADLALIEPAVDVFDPKATRASMGAIFRLSFEYFASFSDYHARFSRNLYPLMTDGKTALDDARFEPPYSLIFGNESAGLPPELFGDLGTSIAIPHDNGIDSLNLSVAVGIALYRAYRCPARAAQLKNR